MKLTKLEQQLVESKKQKPIEQNKIPAELTEEEKEQMRDMAKLGVSLTQIASRCKVSRWTVQRVVGDNGVWRNGNSLPEDRSLQLIQIVKNKELQSVNYAAKTYGYSKATVSRYIRHYGSRYNKEMLESRRKS